jgi:TetR/AcrR family transcriptional regulator
MPPRDPEKTRTAILDAAEKLFAGKGFNGVAMSEIAATAGVNQSLIHHHFGSKAELWTRVVERFDAALPPMASRSLDRQAGRKDLEALISAFFNELGRNPNLARLDAWGKLEEPGTMTELDKRALATVRDLLAYLQETGVLRKGVPPEHVIIAVQALVKNWWLGREQYVTWIGGNERHPQADAKYLKSLLTLLFEGLLPR